MMLHESTSASVPPRQPMLIRPGIVPASSGGYTARLQLNDSADVLVVLCDGLRGTGAIEDALGAFERASLLVAAQAANAPNGMRTRVLGDLQQMMAAANTRVYEKSRYRASSALRVALTAIAIIDRQAYVVNIGGNSVLQVRNGNVSSVVSSEPGQPIVYAGDGAQVERLATNGRPDFAHSFVLNVAIDDRLVICTQSLALRLAEPPQEDGGRPAPPGSRVADITQAVLGHASDPAEAARELAELDRSGGAWALWRPLGTLSSVPAGVAVAPTPLHGGAVVLWCADAIRLQREEGARRRRESVQRVFTLLALLIFVAGFLAVSNSALASYNRTRSNRATATQNAITKSLVRTPTATPSPTAKPVVPLALTPQPSISGITITPRASRTPTPMRVPTTTFTPSPTSTAMPMPAPPTATPSPVSSATSQ